MSNEGLHEICCSNNDGQNQNLLLEEFVWTHSSPQEKVSHAHEEHEANSVNMDNIASLRFIHIFMDSLTFYSIVVVNRSIINVLKEFTNISPTILQQFGDNDGVSYRDNKWRYTQLSFVRLPQFY
jgi:hypothetical protein